MTVINDNNDEDSSNDVSTQAPSYEDLSGFSHTTDDVPAIFDRRIIVNDSAHFSNILATQKVITIPATYNEGTGINDYLNDESAMDEAFGDLSIHYSDIEMLTLLGDPSLKIGGYH